MTRSTPARRLPFPLAAAWTLVLWSVASAAPQTFYIGPRGVKDTTATFELQAPLETIVGTSNKVNGKIVFDAATNTGSVDISIPVASLSTGIDLRDEHLRSERWLHAERYPTIAFKSTGAVPIDKGRWRVKGQMTIHGVTREMEAEVEARVLPRGLETEAAGFGGGDVAKCRTQFEIRLADYNIAIPEAVATKVSDKVTITLDVFASTDPGRLRLAEEEAKGAAEPPPLQTAGETNPAEAPPEAPTQP